MSKLFFWPARMKTLWYILHYLTYLHLSYGVGALVERNYFSPSGAKWMREGTLGTAALDSTLVAMSTGLLELWTQHLCVSKMKLHCRFQPIAFFCESPFFPRLRNHPNQTFLGSHSFSLQPRSRTTRTTKEKTFLWIMRLKTSLALGKGSC